MLVLCLILLTQGRPVRTNPLQTLTNYLTILTERGCQGEVIHLTCETGNKVGQYIRPGTIFHPSCSALNPVRVHWQWSGVRVLSRGVSQLPVWCEGGEGGGEGGGAEAVPGQGPVSPQHLLQPPETGPASTVCWRPTEVSGTFPRDER